MIIEKFIGSLFEKNGGMPFSDSHLRSEISVIGFDIFGFAFEERHLRTIRKSCKTKIF